MTDRTYQRIPGYPRMPVARIYSRELEYWPWGCVLDLIAEYVSANAAEGASVVDYMCGTGVLLERLMERRPDLQAEGCDYVAEYVDQATNRNPSLRVATVDAFQFVPTRPADVAVVAAGLHHLARADQQSFLKKIATDLAVNGVLLVAEELIADHRSERERRRAVADLSFALLEHLIGRDAPADVLQAAVDVLGNDLTESGEYKMSEEQLRGMLRSDFRILQVTHVWPGDAASFGDYIFVCRHR